MSQQLRALTELPEGLNLVPSTHVRWLPTAYNPRGSGTLFWVL